MTTFKSVHLAFVLFYLLMHLFGPASGQQWTRVEALPSVQITALHASGDTLYAAGPVKLYFTYDAGLTWDSSAVLAPNLDDYLTDIAEVTGKIYVGTINDGVFVSTDGGHTFQAINAGLSGLGALAISMLAVRGDSLYASTTGGGIYVKGISGNGPWSSYSQGLPWSNVESIVNDNGTLIAGAGSNATLSVRAPGAAVWTERPFATFNGEIDAFLGVVRDGEVLLGAGNQGFYRSVDGGHQWQFWNPPSIGLFSAVRFIRNGNRTFALLNRSGVQARLFYTENRGESWQLFQPQPGGIAGFDIALVDHTLYAAHINGLWRLQLPTNAPEAPLADKANFEAIFPNPATDRASLKFTLPGSSAVTIALYDARGRLIHTQNEGRMTAGIHTIGISVAGLPSGMYHCALITVYGKETTALSVAR